MDRPWRYHAKWNKLEGKRQINTVWFHSYMEFEAQNKQNKIKINFTEIRLVRENGRGVGETAEGG